MNSKRVLKRIHVFGTMWFLLCAATLLVFSLYQAKLEWWLIFSISGYSAVLLFFVFTIYLFAVYQGVVRKQTAAEHPLSTSLYYIALYDVAPFLGAFAGLMSLWDGNTFLTAMNTVAEGTLITTFLVWIVFDPLVGLVEASLPQSAAHRRQRMAQMRLEKQQQKEAGQRLLHELERKEISLQKQWYQRFEPMAREAAQLLCSQETCSPDVRCRIVELGAMAWKTGQLTCMRYFHRMITDCMTQSASKPLVDYPAIWWDGIGTWRKPQTTQGWYLAASA